MIPTQSTAGGLTGCAGHRSTSTQSTCGSRAVGGCGKTRCGTDSVLTVQPFDVADLHSPRAVRTHWARSRIVILKSRSGLGGTYSPDFLNSDVLPAPTASRSPSQRSAQSEHQDPDFAHTVIPPTSHQTSHTITPHPRNHELEPDHSRSPPVIPHPKPGYTRPTENKVQPNRGGGRKISGVTPDPGYGLAHTVIPHQVWHYNVTVVWIVIRTHVIVIGTR